MVPGTRIYSGVSNDSKCHGQYGELVFSTTQRKDN